MVFKTGWPLQVFGGRGGRAYGVSSMELLQLLLLLLLLLLLPNALIVMLNARPPLQNE